MTTIAKLVGFTHEQLGALSVLGMDLLEAGNLDGANEVFRGVLALDPVDARALMGLALVLQQKGLLLEAEQLLSQVMELRPDDHAVAAARGELRCRRGDAGGVADLKRASQPGSPVQLHADKLLRRFA